MLLQIHVWCSFKKSFIIFTSISFFRILFSSSYNNPNESSDKTKLCFNAWYYTVNILKVFLEQKKMLKSGLNIAHFRQHVSIIEKETKEYFQSWGESGEKSKQTVLVLHLS